MKGKRGTSELRDAEPVAQPTPTPQLPPSAPAHPFWERPMTPKQLAKFLQVSPSTIARQLRDGLPHVKIAGQIRFIPREVLAHYRK